MSSTGKPSDEDQDPPPAPGEWVSVGLDEVPFGRPAADIPPMGPDPLDA